MVKTFMGTPRESPAHPDLDRHAAPQPVHLQRLTPVAQRTLWAAGITHGGAKGHPTPFPGLQLGHLANYLKGEFETPPAFPAIPHLDALVTGDVDPLLPHLRTHIGLC